MSGFSEAEVEQKYAEEVLDDARDIVNNLEVRLQQVRGNTLDPVDAALHLKQDAAILRLKTKAVNIPGLSPLSHRLEEYLASTNSITVEQVDDLQRFSDRISALLDGDLMATEDIAEIVRSMPHKSTFDVGDIELTDTEVTVVLPQKSAAHAVGRELAACGYRVTTVLDPLEAFEIVLETKPDLVVTTMIMPRMSGVDLACALTAMPTTKHIPVALLTSLAPNHPDLRALPMNAGLIRRGETFGADLAHVLDRWKSVV